MAIDRHATGLTVIRLCLGVFFLFEGIGKIAWFTNASILAGRFNGWLADAAVGSTSRWYLEHIAIPGAAVFARLVPLGEMAAGVALILGVWTSLAAFLAFVMVMNIHVASGALFTYAFLTNGYGLPVVGSTLGLAIGGIRLPWSLRK
ncbi:MAG: DoxX family protein [Vicinamibacterales bacterium]